MSQLAFLSLLRCWRIVGSKQLPVAQCKGFQRVSRRHSVFPMALPLFEFLSHVDDSMGVARKKEFIDQAYAVCEKNLLEHTFELAEFNWDKCPEGALCLPCGTCFSHLSTLAGAAPTGAIYSFLKRASRLAANVTAQQLAPHQSSPAAGAGEGVSALVQSLKREMLRVRVDMGKHIQVLRLLSCVRRRRVSSLSGQGYAKHGWHA